MSMFMRQVNGVKQKVSSGQQEVLLDMMYIMLATKKPVVPQEVVTTGPTLAGVKYREEVARDDQGFLDRFVSQQSISPLTIHAPGYNGRLVTQVTKSWDLEGKCLMCPDQHDVMSGSVNYMIHSDQHSPMHPSGSK